MKNKENLVKNILLIEKYWMFRNLYYYINKIKNKIRKTIF